MKILMVCLGNICRSPLAHGVLEHLAREQGLDWEIDSAGTGNWHVGEPPDKRSIAIAKNYGVDISDQRCRQFENEDFERYDYIFVMDYSILNDVKALASSDAHHDKIRMFLKEGVVPDPYHDDNEFDAVYHLVEQRSRELILELSNPELI